MRVTVQREGIVVLWAELGLQLLVSEHDAWWTWSRPAELSRC